MSVLLGAAMLAVVGYCLARSFVPALHPCGRRRDIDAWHVAMGAAMATMLLDPQGRLFAALALVVFAAGLGWSLLRAVSNVARRDSLRLAVGMAAMTAMLVPSLAAPAASATSGGMHGSHGMNAMHGMHSMDPGPAVAAADGSIVPLPVLLTVLLVAALALVLVLRLREMARRPAPAATRLDAACEVAMAVAMGYMLLLMA